MAETDGWTAKFTSNGADKQKALLESLAHVRAFHIFHADLRTKHFHFFILAMGALIGTILLRPEYREIPCVLGAVLSVGFILLDIRAMRLILDARAEGTRLESLSGIILHSRDPVADKESKIEKSARPRWYSMTFVYRVVFGLGTLGYPFIWWYIP